MGIFIKKTLFFLFTIFLIFSHHLLSAQEPSTEEKPLTELSPEVLIQRSSQVANSLDVIYQRVLTLKEQADELSSQIDTRAMERSALKISDPPDSVSAKDGPEQVQTVLTAWNERILQLEALQSILEAQQVLAKKHRETVLKLTSEYRIVEQAGQKIQPLLDVLQQQVAVKQIELTQLPDSLQSLLQAQQEQAAAELVAVEAVATPSTSEPTPAEVIAPETATPPAIATQPPKTDTATTPTIKVQMTLVNVLHNPLEQATHWEAAAGRDELMLTELTATLEALKAEQNAAKMAETSVSAILQEANYRTELKKELTNRDFSDLVALLTTRLESWRNSDEIMQQQITQLTEAVTALETRQAQLEATKPPSAEQFTAETAASQKLREAEEAMLLAEATVSFREERQALLQELQTTTNDMFALFETQQTALDKFLAETLELEVLAETIAELADTEADYQLPKDFSITPISERLITLKAQKIQFKQQQETYTQQTEKWLEALTQAEALLAEAMNAVTERKERLTQELRWHSFLTEVDSQSTAELISTFEKTLTDYQAAQESLLESDIKLEISGNMINLLHESLNKLYDPMSLEQSQKKDSFAQWREQEGIHSTLFVEEKTAATELVAQGNENEATIANGHANTQATPSTESNANSATQEKTQSEPDNQPTSLSEQQIQKTRELRNQMVSRNLLSFTERNEMTMYLLAAYDLQINHLQTQQETLQTALELAKRAWGSATALLTRIGNGDLAEQELPAAMEQWTARDQVLALQQRVDASAQTISEVQQRKQALLEKQFSEVFLTALSDWEANLTRQIAQLKDRLTLEQEYSPPDPSLMDEFEKRRYDRTVMERIEAETTLYEFILTLFVSKQVEDTSQLLQAYYEKLLGLEHRYNNLQVRIEKTQTLIELIGGTTQIFTVFVEALTPIVKKLDEQLILQTTKVKAVLFPSQIATLFEALKDKTGLTLKPENLPQLPPANTDEAAYEAARQALVDSLLMPWASYTVYQGWLVWLEQQLAELGGIDTRMSQLKELIASLESSKKELQQQIDKLAGYDEATLDAMPEEARPKTQKARDTLLLGEIGLLRQERLQDMEWEASKTLVWLLVIPLIALIAVRVVSMIGNRAIKKAHTEAEAEGSNVQDREERVKMLVHVFGIGWKILVSLLAIIYMFKAVNVDVLPIIASAGVLGLAIAFGAQQLVRDFFSGFFILLENQFRVGDNVTINGLNGEVERITPRMTMVRSLAAGSLHYIPNGSIDHVSNNSREWSAIQVVFPISYEADHDKVLACLQQAADELRATDKYGKYIYGFLNRGIESFGELAQEYSVRFQCKSGEQAEIGREYRRRAKRLLQDNGLEIASLATLSNMSLSTIKSATKKGD